MPTYEYQCETCGNTFDVFQSIKARPLRKTKCKSCGTERKVRRLIGTGGAVLFKGSGFYQTDYRSKSYEKAAKAESGSGASPESGKDKPSGGDSSSDKGGAAKKDAAKADPASGK